MSDNTQDFLAAIWGESEGRVSIWWRDGYGKDSPVNRFKWFNYPEQLQEIAEFAEGKSEKDVYFSVATYEEDKRTPKHAKQAQVIFQDTDSMDPNDYRLEPSIVVQSSEGKWHSYWMLDEPQAAVDCSDLTKLVTYAHLDDGTDVSSWSVNKLLRVPGSVNTSYGFPQRVTYTNSGIIYTIDEIREAYADVTLPERTRLEFEVLEWDGNVEHPNDLPDYETVVSKVSSKTLDSVMAVPSTGDAGNRSELRYRILCDLFREGLDFDEVLSVAWHAPATSKWSKEDRRGIRGLVGEANKALAEINREHGVTIAPPDDDFRGTMDRVETSSIINLLTDDERVRADGMENFVTRYMAWSESKSGKHWNRPYDLSNGFTILSVALGACGFIPYDDGTGGSDCTLWMFNLGKTTTGKTKAYERMQFVLRIIMGEGSDYDAGFPGSYEAFMDRLLAYDRRAMFVNKDEVHQFFSQVRNNSRMESILPLMAEVYDGNVKGSMLKSLGDKSGNTAHPRVTMWAQGTPKNVLENIRQSDFDSGYLTRYFYTIGYDRDKPTAPQARKYLKTSEWESGSADPVANEISEGIKEAMAYLDPTGGRGRRAMIPSDEAEHILARIDFSLFDMIDESHPRFDILSPALGRHADNIRRAAALLAMSRGATVVGVDDVLFVTRCAEEWIRNLFYVADRVASDFARMTTDILQWIKERGGKVRQANLMNTFVMEPMEWKRVIDSLTQRGLVEVEVNEKKSGDTFYIAKV